MSNENDEQPGEEKPKVAKTRLYRKVSSENDDQPGEEKPKVEKTKLYRKVSNENDEQPGEDKPKVEKTKLYRKISKESDQQPGEDKPKIAKTKLYRKPQNPEELPAEQEIVPEPEPEKPKTKVARTRLDHKMLENVRSQFGERTNQRLQEEIQKRELEPVKIIEPIKAERKVSSCPFSWTDESAKERVRYCANCQKAIYHLDGMEPEQADALILKRENLEKFVLYERPDGKYMTSDCPVAQKKRVQMMALIAVAGVCIITAVAAMIMMPPPPPPPPTAASGNEATAPGAVTADGATSKGKSSTGESSKGNSSKSDSSSPTTHHYHAGDPIPAARTSEPPQKPLEKSFSEDEQSGEFWQFPNGQPADDFGRSPGASQGN